MGKLPHDMLNFHTIILCDIRANVNIEKPNMIHIHEKCHSKIETAIVFTFRNPASFVRRTVMIIE